DLGARVNPVRNPREPLRGPREGKTGIGIGARRAIGHGRVSSCARVYALPGGWQGERSGVFAPSHMVRYRRAEIDLDGASRWRSNRWPSAAIISTSTISG